MNTATAITIAALAALTPTVTTLIGIILSRQDVRDLRAEMRSEISGVRSEIGTLRSEMIALRTDIHGDLLLIHERVAIVETKTIDSDRRTDVMVAVGRIELPTYGL